MAEEEEEEEEEEALDGMLREKGGWYQLLMLEVGLGGGGEGARGLYTSRPRSFYQFRELGSG